MWLQFTIALPDRRQVEGGVPAMGDPDAID